MKAQDFVRQKYPNSFAERFKSNGPFGTAYYLIWKEPGREKRRLGEGDTESKAWTDAKRNMLEFETEQES